ncbi:MAG: response regulator [Thermodesulfobacteriota bacterium]
MSNADKPRVLVMDDEATIRELIGEVLGAAGYETEFAGDGAEAVEKYRREKEDARTFNVVIMDLTIPGGMGGKEAIKKLLELDPDVRAIVSSGYARDPMMEEYEKYGFTGAIAKPYNIKELVALVNKVVGEG